MKTLFTLKSVVTFSLFTVFSCGPHNDSQVGSNAQAIVTEWNACSVRANTKAIACPYRIDEDVAGASHFVGWKEGDSNPVLEAWFEPGIAAARTDVNSNGLPSQTVLAFSTGNGRYRSRVVTPSSHPLLITYSIFNRQTAREVGRVVLNRNEFKRVTTDESETLFVQVNPLP